MITRTDIAGHLEPLVRLGFLDGVRGYTPASAPFVERIKSERAFEAHVGMGELPWPIRNGGQPAGTGTDSRTGGWQVGGLGDAGPITIHGGEERAMIVYPQQWEITTGITHNAIDDDQSGFLQTWARDAGTRFAEHQDYLAFDALRQGAGTTYGTAYNGLSFFNDSHIDPAAQYQTAQDNKMALALSLDNFETAYVAGNSFLDSRGVPANMRLDLLIHSINLGRAAAQITDNREDSTTSERASNPFVGMISRVQAPGGWLSATNWFVVSKIKKPLCLQIRQEPTLVAWDDYAVGIRYFKWVARYVYFYGNWRAAVLGNA